LTKVVEKIKTHILCSITFFLKSHRSCDNVEKLGGDRGATHDVTVCRIRVACWISKATYTYGHAHAYALAYPMHACTHRPISNTRIANVTQCSVTDYVHRPSCYALTSNYNTHYSYLCIFGHATCLGSKGLSRGVTNTNNYVSVYELGRLRTLFFLIVPLFLSWI
jgi:hypothetical protein